MATRSLYTLHNNFHSIFWPLYLDDYVTGEDPDDAIDDAANCTIDFCYRITNVPQSYQDAISSPEFNKWRDARDKESLIDALWDNETFELTPPPEGQTSVGGGGSG